MNPNWSWAGANGKINTVRYEVTRRWSAVTSDVD